MASIGKIIYEDFSVIDFATNQLVPNIPLNNFTSRLFKNDGILCTTIPVTFQELGNGNYRAKYTPNTKGQWLLCVYHPTYFPWGKNNSIFVDENNIDDLYVISTRILGLSQENYHIDNNIYDSENRLTFGRIRTYKNSIDVGSESNVLATYNIEASYNPDGTLDKYGVSKI